MTNALKAIGKYWDAEVTEVIHAETLGRKLIPINTKLSYKGIGMTEVGTNAYTSRAEAIIDYDIVDDNLAADTVDVQAASLKVPVQQDDCKIKRRAYESFKLKGVPIDADRAADMASNVVTKEDSLIIDGWAPDGTNYEILGMFKVANNTAVGADFDTYGNALASVAAGLGKLWEDNIKSLGYNLLLHPTEYAKLIASYASGGPWEYAQVLEQLNVNAPTKPGTIYQTTDIAANSGLLAPVGSQANKRYFDMIIAKQAATELWSEGAPNTGPVMARVVGALVPRFKHLDSSGLDNCVCTLTGLNG